MFQPSAEEEHEKGEDGERQERLASTLRKKKRLFWAQIHLDTF